jgi:hypothetical protein
MIKVTSHLDFVGNSCLLVPLREGQVDFSLLRPQDRPYVVGMWFRVFSYQQCLWIRSRWITSGSDPYFPYIKDSKKFKKFREKVILIFNALLLSI